MANRIGEKIGKQEIGRQLHRFAFLAGYDMRSDHEQAESEIIRQTLAACGLDPGWPVVPRGNTEALARSVGSLSAKARPS